MAINKILVKLMLPVLPDLDSNQDNQNQNLMYYRYTIGHYNANLITNEFLIKQVSG